MEHFGKWLAANALSLVAIGLIVQAVPDWTLWSTATLWICGGLTVHTFSELIFAARERGKWPWDD